MSMRNAWVLVLFALVASMGCGEESPATACTSSASTIPTGESDGMGGVRFGIACSDLVVRQLRCVSTVAGNPASADMSCTCTAPGSAERTFTLSAADRGRLPFDGSGVPFVAASCGWTLP